MRNRLFHLPISQTITEAKRLKFCLLFILTLFSSFSQGRMLEPFVHMDPDLYEISIITAGRGNEIYMLGGHLLLRVKEKRENGKDISVNWGIFNFNDPHFAFNYAIGKLDYQVQEAPTSRIMYQYRHPRDMRQLYNNRVFLTNKQKQVLVSRAAWWLLPENSTYRYHFYDTNCSTIIRDLLSEAIGPAFDKQLKEQDHKTFRIMGRRYFSNYPFFAFLAPMLFNSDADDPISYWHRFRVPVEAPDILADIKAVDDKGHMINQALLGPKTVLQEGTDIGFAQFEYSFFVLFFFSLLALLAWYFGHKKTKHILKFRALGFALISVGIFNFFWSTLMLILWIFTEHTYTHHNANLLLLWPVDILFLVLGFKLLIQNEKPKESFFTKTLKILLRAHLMGMLVQLALWLTGWIQQDVTFIYAYVMGPFVLISLLCYQKLGPKNL